MMKNGDPNTPFATAVDRRAQQRRALLAVDRLQNCLSFHAHAGAKFGDNFGVADVAAIDPISVEDGLGGGLRQLG